MAGFLNILLTVFDKIFYVFRLVLTYIPVLIYNKIYSKYFTKYSYDRMADRFDFKTQNIKKILDVGVGTGHPLFSIIHRIPQETQVVGIDIDRNYIHAAKKIFANNKNVEIKEMNFFNLAKTNEKYDVIIFSSSFMLMPNREMALEIAKKHLSDNGRIYFLMTIYTKQGALQKFVAKIKPYLKYMTTIDFGTIVYENEFSKMIQDNDLQITFQERLSPEKTFILKIFKMNVVEVQHAK